MKGTPACSRCSRWESDVRIGRCTPLSQTSTSSPRSTPSPSPSPTPTPHSPSLTEGLPASPRAPSPSSISPPLPPPQSPSQSPYHLLLVFDFDSTLTLSSALPSLLSLPTYAYQSHNLPICAYIPTDSPCKHPRPLHPPTAADLSSTYYTHLHRHDSSYVHLPRTAQADTIYQSSLRLRRTLPQELAYQSSLRHVERASFLRGKQAFADAGVNASHLEAAASTAQENGTVQFRDGWNAIMELVAEANANVENRIAIGIISVSWSHQWIRNLVDRAMGFYGLVDEERHFLHKGPDAIWDPSRVDIRANDIFSKRPGSEEAGIYVSADKAREMADMVQQRRLKLRQGSGGTSESESRTIYVGDSVPDLECLLAADIGILIRTATMGSEQHELSKALRRLGISFSWLGHYTQQRKAARLWWAQDLEEIAQSGILDPDGGSDRDERSRKNGTGATSRRRRSESAAVHTLPLAPLTSTRLV